MRESIIDVTSMNVNDYSPSLLREGESLVKIHSPTCGYCKELEPEWKNLEEYVSNTYDKYPISLISIEGGVVNKFNPDFEVNG